MPDIAADPFQERGAKLLRLPLHLLGGRFEFQTTSRELMRLVRWAYADLPAHRMSLPVPRCTIRLVLGEAATPASPGEPPPLTMLSGAGTALWRQSLGQPRHGFRAAAGGAGDRGARHAALSLSHALRADRVRGVHPRGTRAGADAAACRLRRQRAAGSPAHRVERRRQVDRGAALRTCGARPRVGRQSVRGAAESARQRGRQLSYMCAAESLRFLSSADAALLRRSPDHPPPQRRREARDRSAAAALSPRPRAARKSSRWWTSRRGRRAAGRCSRRLGPRELLRRLRASQPYAASQPGWGNIRRNESAPCPPSSCAAAAIRGRPRMRCGSLLREGRSSRR